MKNLETMLAILKILAIPILWLGGRFRLFAFAPRTIRHIETIINEMRRLKERFDGLKADKTKEAKKVKLKIKSDYALEKKDAYRSSFLLLALSVLFWIGAILTFVQIVGLIISIIGGITAFSQRSWMHSFIVVGALLMFVGVPIIIFLRKLFGLGQPVLSDLSEVQKERNYTMLQPVVSEAIRPLADVMWLKPPKYYDELIPETGTRFYDLSGSIIYCFSFQIKNGEADEVDTDVIQSALNSRLYALQVSGKLPFMSTIDGNAGLNCPLEVINATKTDRAVIIEAKIIAGEV